MWGYSPETGGIAVKLFYLRWRQFLVVEDLSRLKSFTATLWEKEYGNW
jgi:hypothetical protein